MIGSVPDAAPSARTCIVSRTLAALAGAVANTPIRAMLAKPFARSTPIVDNVPLTNDRTVPALFLHVRTARAFSPPTLWQDA